MAEQEPEVAVVDMVRRGFNHRKALILGFLGISTLAGAAGGLLVIDALDDDESAIAAHNATVDKCLELSPEMQLTSCASDFIYGFKFENYVEITGTSVDDDGALVLNHEIDAEAMAASINADRDSVGFEPEAFGYEIAGGTFGGAVGLFSGAMAVGGLLMAGDAYNKLRTPKSVVGVPATQ